ncbi:MAG: glycerate kinase [Acholeplasmataceae bacterium]
MKILVAVDSFKGTLSSVDISHLIKRFYSDKDCQVEAMPISDGGEGFVDAINDFYREKPQKIVTLGSLGDPIEASYIIHDGVAFIELSNVNGLNKIDETRMNPLETTTYGLGLVVKDAIAKGSKRIVIGLGGSATNDAAAGLVQALGVRFYDHDRPISDAINGNLVGSITGFDTSELDELIENVSFVMASDVKNPLLGQDGCAHIYARQKGATERMQNILEQNMTRYADVVEKHFERTYRFVPGAGAAGGFGFGAMAFLKADIHSGIDYMIRLLDIEEKIKESDVVIVGEGRLDRQTRYGKAPYGIARLAKKHQKRVIGIFAVSEDLRDIEFLDDVHVIVPKYADLETSLSDPKRALRNMLEHIKVS